MGFRVKALVILSSLAIAALGSLTMLVACARTPGAPEDDYYEPESAAQASEEEAEEDAWEDTNR